MLTVVDENARCERDKGDVTPVPEDEDEEEEEEGLRARYNTDALSPVDNSLCC